jgi:predicted nucleotidyltransferase
MKHDERWRIAENVAQKAVQNHKGKVLFVAAAGSTAAGKDGDLSDLDIVIASSEKIGVSRKFIYKDIIVEPFYITRKEAEEIFLDPSNSSWESWNESWQGWMMLIHTCKVIWGDEKILKEMQALNKSLPSEVFAKAAAKNLVLIYEFINHMKAVLPYNSLPDMLYLGVAVRKLAIDFVALMNGKYYLTYDWVGEAKSFANIPSNYAQLASNYLKAASQKRTNSE